MGTKVTLQLQDEVVSRALEIAGRSEQNLEEVLADWLTRFVDELPIELLSDREVLELCQFEFNPIYRHEMRYLLHYHHTIGLNGLQNRRLDELLSLYRKGLVRRARAHQVALARGLQDQPTG